MKWDISAIMARADKVIALKHKMLEAFPDMEVEQVDRLVFAAGFQDAFREGTKSGIGGLSSSSKEEMMVFAKFARDFKSPKDIQACLEAFIQDKDAILKKYKL